jgi:hypothetical protein
LERQLQLYTAAPQTAAIIATSFNQDEVQGATKRFLQLFSGELALAENLEVASAMQDFRRGLPTLADINRPQGHNGAPKSKTENPEIEREARLQLSLNLAAACRNSLALSWGTGSGSLFSHPFSWFLLNTQIIAFLRRSSCGESAVIAERASHASSESVLTIVRARLVRPGKFVMVQYHSFLPEK